MAIRDSHGVVVAAYAPTSGYHRDHGVPAIHRPGYRDGLSTLASGDWELFPNLDVALEAGYHACQNCFPGVEDRPTP